MQAQELLELADLNLAEATREMARWHADSELIESDDWLLAAGPDPFPVGFTNSAMALGARAPADPAAALARSAAFFGARGRGYTVWTREHLDGPLIGACDAAGLHRLGDSPGMVLEARSPDLPAPPGARLALAGDPAAVRDLAEVSARAYAGLGLPPAVTHRVFEQAERLLRPQLLAVVAYLEGAPCAAALALLSHGVAGLYWVGTVEEARRRGLGEACTRAVGNAAFDRGAARLFLQASREGEPIYARMGYRTFTRYRWHVATPP